MGYYLRIILKNFVGDVNLNTNLLKVGKDMEVKTLVTDFSNLLAKAHKGIKFLEYDEFEKNGINKRIEIDMKSNIKFPVLFLVLCILITGCMDSSFNKKININNIESDINGFYKKFSTDYLNEEITVVNKNIIGWDGEVVKYIDANNKVSRCTVIIYGEDEKSTLEYYFIDGYTYVTILKEYYAYPIYYSYNRSIDIMYRTFDEVVIYDSMIYKLVNGEFIKKNIEDIKMPYTSLQEINEAIGE